MDEKHADLLMIPISDDNKSFHKPEPKAHRPQSPSTSVGSTGSRTETPAAPTPAPKPQLPEGYNDWDSYLSQRKESTATLPLPESEGEWIKSSAPTATRKLQSPELHFKHSFEQLGWRDCLNQKQRQKTNALRAKALPRIPSNSSATSATTSDATLLLPLVYDATSPGNSSSATSLRSVKRLSNASTLTTNTTEPSSTTAFLNTTGPAKRLSVTSTKTAASMPCYLPSTAYKRLSGASTLTTNTTATVPCYLSHPHSTASKRLSGASTLTFASTSTTAGKPRSIRRINRARHLRAYYSDGSLLRGRRLSAGISSMQGIREHSGAPPVNQQQQQRVAIPGELCAPPPFPPPEKPLPSLPRGVMRMAAKLPVVVEEVRELHTGERARWREVLLRGLARPRREVGWRRAGSPAVRC